MKRRTWRLLLLLVVGALLMAGVLIYCEYWLARPFGSGPAGPPVAAEPFQGTWTERKVLLLGVGDSITAGFGVDESHSLLGRLADNPSDEFPDMQGKCLRSVLPGLRVLNIAVSGSTSLDHVDIIRKQLKPQPADLLGLVVMTTGGNDLIHDYGRSPPREGAMYGATLEEAQPWIDNFEQRLGEIHAAYNAIIHRAAAERENVHVVPLHETFLGHGVHCVQPWRAHYRSEDPTYWYGFNLEDPNIRGYDAARRVFLIEIVKAAEEFK